MWSFEGVTSIYMLRYRQCNLWERRILDIQRGLQNRRVLFELGTKPAKCIPGHGEPSGVPVGERGLLGDPCRALQAIEEVHSDGLGINGIPVLDHGVSDLVVDNQRSP